ncbi:MAG TPA: TetR/AcrR family transcriptional regulator [Gaiellaceae bacterium]|nr:TetR/AcrR family transcriptional regulator [Gaiellaceae bacterium]
MNPAATERKTAEERREAILEAALTEFAERGYVGASTDAIARAAGISQPYLFRLFGTKKELFLETERRCLEDTYQRFATASQGLSGEAALEAMGQSYKEMITGDTRMLRGQLQAYAACQDPEVCEVVRAGFGKLVGLVESKGVPAERVSTFFAIGMLCNVVVAMDLMENPLPWVESLTSLFSDKQ